MKKIKGASKFTRLAAIMCATTLCIACTGCGNHSENPLYDGKSWDELVTMNEQSQQMYNELSKSYDDLSALFNGISNENSPTAAISVAGDGTNRLTFNSNDSRIIFPSSFEYPASEQATSTGSVSIIENATVTPGSNWISKLNGSTLEIEHTSGISGTIKVGMQKSIYTAEELKVDVLTPWFEGLPLSEVNYSEIAVDTVKSGCQATTPTLIDSEDAFLRCGMFAFKDLCVTYVFVYRGNQDATKDESITSLLNTFKLYGATTIVEQ